MYRYQQKDQWSVDNEYHLVGLNLMREKDKEREREREGERMNKILIPLTSVRIGS